MKLYIYMLVQGTHFPGIKHNPGFGRFSSA